MDQTTEIEVGDILIIETQQGVFHDLILAKVPLGTSIFKTLSIDTGYISNVVIDKVCIKEKI